MPPQGEEYLFKCDGLKLKGYLYAAAERRKKSPLLVLCHGIPAAPPPGATTEGGAAEDGGYPALARRCAAEGYATFHFNFRGTGESEGDFDLAGWQRDLAAALDGLEKEWGEGAFLLWGFSAGAAVSCSVAAGDGRVKGLILAASPAEFFSLFPPGSCGRILETLRQRGIIRDPSFPGDPRQWMGRIYGSSPLFKIGAVAPRPLLLMHGSRDELIHFGHAFRLYRQAGAGAELVILPAAPHQLRRHPSAVKRGLDWLNARCT